MPDLTEEKLKPYLETLLRSPVKILGLAPLGKPLQTGDLKGYGYGAPIHLSFEVAGRPHRAVLETMSPGPFGHEGMADRAQAMVWGHAAFNRLPRHVRSLDVGGFQRDGTLLSLGELEEPFLLMEYAEGEGYFQDLIRLREGAPLLEVDRGRADALCDYLVEIHRLRGPDPGLYVRRIRELVGHGECIMGLIDSYPPEHGFINAKLLEEIELRSVAWRWRLKGRTDRLRQVHGDFHPWNILFRSGTDFTVLDRSRGEWGDPADDVACLTMNYLFFSLQRSGHLDGDFEALFGRFWRRYLEKSGDQELPEVVAPFFAFRGLVMASPIWYPRLDEGVRRKLFTFIQTVLNLPSFDPERVNDYCGI
ncbi:MAG TPA: aminoglycoside phosphotransferase family protein [Candidatus Manganitrophaceae bacterium]|nr:aminoglycoside phosphotransferase family protein [Candidatus Manganitrophaceae bacterium]